MKLLNQNQNKFRAIQLALFLSTLLCVESAWAVAPRLPKFGPYAIPITQQTQFLRQTPAYDYWKFSQFYLPQQTSSACGLATTVMALNFLRGIPQFSDETLITQNELLQTVFTGLWAGRVAEGGDGLKFDDWVLLVNKSLNYYGLNSAYRVEIVRLPNTSAGLAQLKQKLAANEGNRHDLMLAYFNQGVLTSDWDGPHISPIGAYDNDPTNPQVLIMDVDRDWYPPYWSPVNKLLEAINRRAPPDQGILKGEIGGILWIRETI